MITVHCPAFSVYKRFLGLIIVIYIKFRINQPLLEQLRQASQCFLHFRGRTAVNQLAASVVDPVFGICAVGIAPAFNVKVVAVNIVADSQPNAAASGMLLEGF